MKLDLDMVVGATLAICAVVVTSAVVYRQFVASPNDGQVEPPTFVESWQSVFAAGRQVGHAAAPVKIIEFSDFECPFCADFHQTLSSLQSRFPQEIVVAYLHFPIPGHRFAVPAARAAECAADQDRYEAMHVQLFKHQDEFGIKPWTDFAVAANVPDIGAFTACIQHTDAIARVEREKALGESLGVRGTPTIIINGWKLGRPPNASELEAMVQAVIAGKSPVSSE